MHTYSHTRSKIYPYSFVFLQIFLYTKLTVLQIIQRGPFKLLHYAYAGTQTNFKIAENLWYAFSNYVDYTVYRAHFADNYFEIVYLTSLLSYILGP